MLYNGIYSTQILDSIKSKMFTLTRKFDTFEQGHKDDGTERQTKGRTKIARERKSE